MTMRKMNTEDAGFDLEDALRAGSRQDMGAAEVDIADRLSGNLPSVDRVVSRPIGPRSAFALAVVTLTGALILVTMLNHGDKERATVVDAKPPRIDLPERGTIREDVNVRLATWTTPLESEARALRASLTRSMDSFRQRIPERWRERFADDQPSD